MISLEVALDFAPGCVRDDAAQTHDTIPGINNRALDGYAMRSDDTSVGRAHLRVVGSVRAGNSRQPRLESGEATLFMTGAPMPSGTDYTFMIEEVAASPRGNEIHVARPLTRGENVRLAGESVALGQVLVTPGSERRPYCLAPWRVKA